MSDIPNIEKYEFGYIYLRSHVSYIKSNIIKVGMTSDLVNRDCVYATGEEYRGKYEYIYKFKYEIIKIVDNHIKKYFKHLNHYKGGSTELFKTNIINELEEFFNLHSYEYTKFLVEDIERLYKEIEDRIKQDINEDIDDELDENLNSDYCSIKPREDQIEIINKSIEYFKYNDKGILALCCGFGKTIISLLILKKLNVNKILVLVPSVILIDQWIDKIKQIFTNKKINKFDNVIKDCDIIVTIYHNSKKIKDKNFKFDFVVLDECHHLTSINGINDTNSNFLHSLKLNTKFQLSLTATCKKLKNNSNTIDNYNTHFFGSIIDNKNIKYGIENNIITDFNIQLMILDKDNIEYNNDILHAFNNKKLYIAAFIALNNLKLGLSKHILIYANSIENTNIIINYINLFIFNKIFTFGNDFKFISYTSKNKNNINIINDYKLTILISVYALGEGFDMPRLDTVIFSENMISEIRIIQSALRPCRKYLSKNKALIILPMLCDNFVAHSDEFKKIRKTIMSMINGDELYESYMIKKIKLSYYKKIKNNLTYYLDIDKLNIDDELKFINNIILSKNDFKQLEKTNDFLNHEFAFSKIELIKIKNIKEISNFAYSNIIKTIYLNINDADIILKNTSLTKGVLNYNKHQDPKVYYIESLNLFIRGIDSNTAVKEIICITKNLNIDIELHIKLSEKYNNKIITYP